MIHLNLLDLSVWSVAVSAVLAVAFKDQRPNGGVSVLPYYRGRG